MLIWQRRLTGCVLVVLGIGAALIAAPAPAAVLVNELLASPGTDWDGDGAVDIKLDEWVEVVNTGPETVDLAGYFLRDGTGDTPHLELQGVLAPGEVAVFFGGDAVAWQAAHDAGNSGLSLNNGGDTVDVIVPDPDNPDAWLVVDHRTYLAHEGATDRASGLVNGAWTLFDALDPYGGDLIPRGTGCQPTPGFANLCESTPIEPVTWGSVKSAFQ